MLGFYQKEEDKIFMQEDKTSQIFHEKIAMTMEKTSYPLLTEKVDVTIQNNTSINIYTNLDYSIEYYNGTEWNKLPLDIVYFLIRVTILPQESKGFSIYLHPEQHKYQQGKYRVCKTVSTTKHKENPNCMLYNLTAEFNFE